MRKEKVIECPSCGGEGERVILPARQEWRPGLGTYIRDEVVGPCAACHATGEITKSYAKELGLI